ncbi:ABC-type glycerol-3-phosphate transport system substrate-binding protein [Paenibacillus sp. DS2015]|uniref:ABC transporter substrate-binding protein n=1 Tax=Paenibacillus sp. DS2015 TaxID=3373917 RepID=UPI003D24B67B
MKAFKKGTARLTGLILAFSLVFAGCSNGNSNEASPSNSPASSNSSGEEIDWNTVKADIRFVYPGTSESEKLFAETFKNAMKEKYPNVNIEFMYLSWADMEKKISVMISTGDVPDIATTQDVTNFVQMDGLEDLAPYMQREDSTVKADQFLPGTLDYSSVEGKIYAAPATANAFNLMVNEKMLNDVGMKIEDLQTWGDMEKAAELMTKDGKYGFGYPMGVARFAFRVPFTAGYSNDLLISDTSDQNKTKYIELLNHFKKLEAYQPKAHLTWGYPEMFRAYSNGEVGMIPAGTFFSSNVYSINPDIINVSRAIPYPKGPSGSAAKTPVANSGFGIYKGSKNKEVAWKLIEELLSPEFNSTQAAILNISAEKATSLDEVIKKAENVYPKAIDGHKRVIEDFLGIVEKSGVPMDKIIGQPEMETVVQDVMVKMMTNKMDAEEAFNAIKKGIDPIITKYAK